MMPRVQVALLCQNLLGSASGSCTNKLARRRPQYQPSQVSYSLSFGAFRAMLPESKTAHLMERTAVDRRRQLSFHAESTRQLPQTSLNLVLVIRFCHENASDKSPKRLREPKGLTKTSQAALRSSEVLHQMLAQLHCLRQAGRQQHGPQGNSQKGLPKNTC